MTLGERIIKYRTERHLSQSDLAEALEVSRQSVSKWETDTAVPEIEKLISLCDFFNVTMDELVRGKEPGLGKADGNGGDDKVNCQTEPKEPERYEKPEKSAQYERPEGFSGRRIAGTVLLCMGVVILTLIVISSGDAFGGLVLVSPFILCGIICFAVKKHTGLWCAWCVYILSAFYMIRATSINWKLIFYTFSFTYEMNYVRLIMAWIYFILMIGLVCFTAFSFRNSKALEPRKNRKKLILWSAAVFLAAWGLSVGLSYMSIRSGGITGIWPSFCFFEIMEMAGISGILTAALSSRHQKNNRKSRINRIKKIQLLQNPLRNSGSIIAEYWQSE